MTKENEDPFKEFRESLYSSESSSVKKARKKYNQWVSDFKPLYVLSDTPKSKPANWKETQIWTQIESDHNYVTNGFMTDTGTVLEFVSGYYLTSNHCTSAPFSQKIALSVNQDCPDCNGVGEDDDGEDCLTCEGTGVYTTDFTDITFLSKADKDAAPKYVGWAKDLPDPQGDSDDKTSNKKKAMFCSQCGEKLSANSKFCNQCGNSVDS